MTHIYCAICLPLPETALRPSQLKNPGENIAHGTWLCNTHGSPVQECHAYRRAVAVSHMLEWQVRVQDMFPCLQGLERRREEDGSVGVRLLDEGFQRVETAAPRRHLC